MKMDKFTNGVLKTIDKYQMIKPGQMVIVALSGGYDSLCMLYILNELKNVRKFSLCAAHLNHSYRPEADSDEEFVKNLCKSLGIEAYTRKVDVLQYSKERKISFETAGREVRYAFFEELMEKMPRSVTATAHNANDSAESFIMHLLRGSGLSGLVGIRPVRGRIIRPLIETTREEIEKYCKEKGLTPRIDKTNFDDDYTRNDIRHNVMPPLIERGGIKAIARAARLLSQEDEFLSEYTGSVAKKLFKHDNDIVSIDAKAFNDLPLAIRRRLLRLAIENSKKEISLTHIDSIISIAEKGYGGKHAKLPGGITACLEKGKINIKTRCHTND
jgi:tRNA(Ile)-lysidine synthase